MVPLSMVTYHGIHPGKKQSNSLTPIELLKGPTESKKPPRVQIEKTKTDHKMGYSADYRSALTE